VLEALNLFSDGSFKTEVIVVDNESGEETIFKIQERYPKSDSYLTRLTGDLPMDVTWELKC